MKEYKKSYKGLIIWLAAFLAVSFAVPFLPKLGEDVLTLIMMNIVSLSTAILAGIIYKTESVYWYTGIEFEQAEKAGSRARKEYALKHFRLFSIYAAAVLVYSAAAYFIKIPIAFTITVITLGLIITALCTIKFKL